MSGREGKPSDEQVPSSDCSEGGLQAPYDDLSHDFHLLSRLRLLDPSDVAYPGPRRMARIRMLFWLAQGYPEGRVAKMLRVSRQDVNYHARKFIAEKALKHFSKSPNLCRPGPHFALAVASLGRGYGGWSGLTVESPAARVHGLYFVARVASRDKTRRLPRPDGTAWRADGQVLHQHHVLVLPDGESVRIRHSTGPRKESLTLYLKPLYLAGECALVAAPAHQAGRISRALAVLEKRHGFRFSSLCCRGQREVAFPMPSLSGLAGWGRQGFGHIDRSEGPAEIEALAWWCALTEMRRRERLALGLPGVPLPGLVDFIVGGRT